VESLHGSRALRRMVLAAQDKGYQTGGKRLADRLWPAFQSCKADATGHGKKVSPPPPPPFNISNLHTTVKQGCWCGPGTLALIVPPIGPVQFLLVPLLNMAD